MTTPQGGQGGFNLGNAHGKVLIDASQVQQGLSQAERQIQGFGQRMAGAFDGIATQFQQIGGAMSALSIPLAGVGVAGVRTAATFEDSMAEIAARTGLAGEAMDAIRDKAMQLGADTKFSAQESADAFLQLLTAGLSVEQTFASIDVIMDGAAAAGADFGIVADQVTNVMSSMGLSAEEAGRIVQTMSNAAATSPASMTEMGEAMQTAGGIAKNYGMEVEDLGAVLSVFANNGVRGSEAATQLRSLLQNMSRPTKRTQDAWDALGTSLYDAEGNMRNLDTVFSDIEAGLATMSDRERNETIQALAGSYGMVGFNALLASDGIVATRQRMDEQASVSEIAAQRMATFNGQLTSLRGSIETLLISAFTPFIEQMTPLITRMIEAVNAVRAWTEANPELTTGIVRFAAVLTAVGPTLLAIGTAMKFALVFANPFALAVTGIAVAASYVVSRLDLLFGVFDRMRQFAETEGISITEAFFKGFEDGSSYIGGFLEVLFGIDSAGAIAQGIRQILAVIFRRDFVGGTFAEDSPFIDFLFNLRDATTITYNMIVGTMRQMYNALFFAQMTGGGAFQYEDHPVLGVLFDIHFAVQRAIDSIRAFMNIFRVMGGRGISIVDRLRIALEYTFGRDVSNTVERTFKRIQRTIERVIDAVLPMFEEIGEFIGRLDFSQHIRPIAEWGMRLYSLTSPIGILSNILRMFHVDTLAIFESITAGITGFFAALNNGMSPIMALEYAILQAFGVNGQLAFIRLRELVTGVFNRIQNAVQTAIPIVQGIIAGLGDTIAGLWARISPHLQRFGNWFLNDTLPAVGGVVESSGGLINALADTIVDLWNTVRPHLANFGDWFLNSGLPAIGNLITDTVLPQIEDFIDVLTRIWTDFSPYAVQIVDWFLNDVLPRIIEFVNITVVPAIEFLRDLMAGIWNAVQPALNSLYEWFVNTGMPFIVTTITEGLTAGIQLVIDILSTIWNVVSGPLNAFKDGIIATIGWITNNVIQPLIDSLETAVELLGNLQGAGDLVGQAGTIAQEAGNVGIGEFFGIVGRSIRNQFRADGGPVSANNPYIVGERGPELFVPNSSGGIIPNEALGGSRVDIGTITVHANTPAEGRAAAQALAEELEAIMNRSGTHYSMGAV